MILNKEELRKIIQDYAIDFHNSYKPGTMSNSIRYPVPDIDKLVEIILTREKVVWAQGYDQGVIDNQPSTANPLRSKDYNLGYDAGHQAGTRHGLKMIKSRPTTKESK